MKFTVVWNRRAENDLAALWLAAENREEIATVADMLDATLQEAEHLDRRILYAPPLAIDFKVLAEDRIVQVLSCWRPF